MTSQTKSQPVAAEKHYIQIRVRPWYVWVLGVLWVIALVMLVQNAITSAAELEPRASMLFWITAAVLLLAGIVIAFVRRDR